MCRALPVLTGAHAATNPFNHHRKSRSGSRFLDEETGAQRREVAHAAPRDFCKAGLYEDAGTEPRTSDYKSSLPFTVPALT